MYDFVKVDNWRMADGYICRSVYLADGTHTTQLYHRYVIENEIGRRLTTEEVVHHVNGVKVDNRLENLEIMSQSQHSLLHHREAEPPKTVELVCSTCKKTFHRRKYLDDFRKKRHVGTFCSKSCAVAVSRAKFTEEQIREIKSSIDAGESRKSICSRFKTSAGNVSRILSGKSYKHVLR